MPEYRSGTVPASGQLVYVDAAASVQFAGARAVHLRVIRVDARLTYHGWLWIEGYVVDAAGAATERREVFVQQAGLRSPSA
jgi:hypothetical protein